MLNLRPSKAAPNYLFIDFSREHRMYGLFIVWFQLATRLGRPALVAMVRCTNFLGHNTKQDQTAATDSSFALFLPCQNALTKRLSLKVEPELVPKVFN